MATARRARAVDLEADTCGNRWRWIRSTVRRSAWIAAPSVSGGREGFDETIPEGPAGGRAARRRRTPARGARRDCLGASFRRDLARGGRGEVGARGSDRRRAYGPHAGISEMSG